MFVSLWDQLVWSEVFALSLCVSLYIWPHSVGLTTSLRPTCLVLPPMPMIAFSVRCVYDSFLPLLSNIGRWIGATAIAFNSTSNKGNAYRGDELTWRRIAVYMLFQVAVGC